MEIKSSEEIRNKMLKEEQDKLKQEFEKEKISNQKWKELEKKINRVRSIIEKDIVDFHNLEYREYIDDYKRYLWDVSERLQYIEPWQTNASHPLVFMMVDTIFWTIFDFDYQLEIKDKWVERACVRAYDFMNKSKRAIWEAAKEALIIGKSIIRDYTYFESWEYEAFGESIPYNIKSPTMEYISAFNIMYDRMRGLNNSSYKIIRHFLTKDEIMWKIKWILSENNFNLNKKKIEEKINKLKEWESNNSFSYYNYEAIKWLLFSSIFQDRIINNVIESNKLKEKNSVKYKLNLDEAKNKDDLTWDRCREICSRNNIASLFLNDFDEKYEVVEFIENKEKYFFINWEFVFATQINPHIYNLTAFHYNEIPWSGKSVWVSFILKHLVDASNAMLNMFFDSVKLGNTMLFKQNNLGKTTNHIPLKNWTVVTGDIQRINLWWNDFAWMNGVQTMQTISQSTLWVNDLIMWGDARVQRIAWAFDFAFSQYKSRLTPFTDSIDMAMSKIVKGWISQYISLYTKDELKDLFEIEVTEVKEWNTIIDFLLNNVSIRDILNENNITFKFDSMFNLKKDALKKTAMEVFQLAQQYNNEKVDWVKLLKLLAGDDSIKLEEILWLQEDDINEILKSPTTEQQLTDEDLQSLLNELPQDWENVEENIEYWNNTQNWPVEQFENNLGTNIPEDSEEPLTANNLI